MGKNPEQIREFSLPENQKKYRLKLDLEVDEQILRLLVLVHLVLLASVFGIDAAMVGGMMR